jgi:GABA(A) receptor-associated protein
MKFKQEYQYEERVKESTSMRNKYPDRIPVICEKNGNNRVPEIDKKKYLVPSDLTVGQFIYIIRKRLKLSSDQAIFIFINEFIPPSNSLLSHMDELYRDKDGFMYITYSGESVFGSFN